MHLRSKDASEIGAFNGTGGRWRENAVGVITSAAGYVTPDYASTDFLLALATDDQIRTLVRGLASRPETFSGSVLSWAGDYIACVAKGIYYGIESDGYRHT